MSNRRVDDRCKLFRPPPPTPQVDELDPELGRWLREDDELAELAELTTFARAIRGAFGRPRVEPTERERVERMQRGVLQRLGLSVEPSAASRAAHDAVLDAALRDFSGPSQQRQQLHYHLSAVRNRPNRRPKQR